MLASSLPKPNRRPILIFMFKNKRRRAELASRRSRLRYLPFVEQSSRAGGAGFATSSSQTGGTDSARSRDRQSTPGDRAGLPPSPPLGAAFTCYPSPFFRMYRKSACYPSLLTCYPSPFACYPSPFACYPSGCPLLPFGLLSRVPSNLRSPLIGSIGLRK